MGAFGSFLGGLLTVAGIALSIWTTFTITQTYLVFLLFPLFGLLGGISLGALNGRKARTYAKYKNEYTAYAAMAFTAIVALMLYYFIFGFDKITSNNVSDFADSVVVIIGAASGLLVQVGLGLVIANSLAENY